MDSIRVGLIVEIVLGIVACIFVLSIFFGSFFTIHTKQAGIVERFGKFSRVALPGLNWKTPFIESCVYVEDLNMQLLDVPVVSKTKDNATVSVPVRVQYYVLPEKVQQAYYELDDPEAQIKAHVENVLLSYIPKLTLDETYQQEDDIAIRVKKNLTEVMSKFGYAIENALVTNVIPSNAVLAAMNDIIAARSEKTATEARAEAEKIKMVREAEGRMEAQVLAGKGVAGERAAIVEGLAQSVEEFEGKVQGVTAQQVMNIIMLTQYYDALVRIGAESNTIMLNHAPDALQNVSGQMQEAILLTKAAGGGK